MVKALEYADAEKEQKDDTIDDDSIDFGNVTLADFTDDLGHVENYNHTGEVINLRRIYARWRSDNQR